MKIIVQFMVINDTMVYSNNFSKLPRIKKDNNLDRRIPLGDT